MATLEFASRRTATAVRKLFRSSVLANTMFLALLVGSTPEAKAEIPADFDSFVEKSMKKYNVPGAAVAIVDGEKTYAKGFGVRSVDKPGSVDADTLFMLASNSKPFTAALVAIMVDRKKIGWNDHVIDYLPEFCLKDEYATRMTTPKDLLAHRTGLPPFGGDNLEALGFTREESLYKFRLMQPACSFREKANYSNPGFVSAGMLAAKLGGDSWENLITKELLQPLSMNRSGVSSKDFSTKTNVADAHSPLPDGTSKVIARDSSDTFGPAGSINSTANDMVNWVKLQLNGGSLDGRKIISNESVEEMHKPAMVDEPSFAEMPPIYDNCGLSYGLGWGIYYYKGHKILEKGGARAGMRSVVVLVPDKKLGIAVMANQNLTVLPEAIRAYLIDKMVASSDTDLQAEISTANDNLIKMFLTTPAKTTSEDVIPLKNYVGEYSNELYGVVKVLLEGNELRWQAGPHKVVGTLTHIGYNTFSFAWPPGRISLPEDVSFTLGADGIPTQLETESFGLLKRISN